MLHSRYIRRDREQLETEIKEFAGSRKVLDEPNNGIWVSTSLVEASLDLDFDYLFTELQDLNSLFQRMGRCNRLGLKGVDEVNCFVYLQINQSLLGDFIDEKIYDISKNKLLSFAKEKNESLMDEQEKVTMLKQFTTEKMKDSEYMKKFNETYRLLDLFRRNPDGKKKELRHIQSQEIIPYCVFDKYCDEIKDLEEKLEENGLSQGKRIQFTHELKKYTVSIPYYVYRNYRNNLNKGKSINRGSVRVSDYERIPIVGCTYTEKKGFESLEDKDVDDPMIW